MSSAPRSLCLLLVTAALAPAVQAHEVAHLGPHNLYAAGWSPQLWLWAVWLVPGMLVLAGIARLWRQARVGAGVARWQAACFLGGWLSIGLAVLSPLDALGEELFWAHMVQHEVMMLIAAPLLVWSRPLAPLVWGLPATWRPRAAAFARRSGLQWAMRVCTQPATAWWVHAIALWGWHAPAAFEAALASTVVHDLQHTSFFLSALVFWWALFESHAARRQQGVAVFYLFTTLLHTSALGALLTFSTRLWYPSYQASAPAWGLSALEDQQLGGLIMWVPGGMVFLGAALWLLARWLQGADRAARPGRP